MTDDLDFIFDDADDLDDAPPLRPGEIAQLNVLVVGEPKSDRLLTACYGGEPPPPLRPVEFELENPDTGERWIEQLAGAEATAAADEDDRRRAPLIEAARALDAKEATAVTRRVVQIR